MNVIKIDLVVSRHPGLAQWLVSRLMCDAPSDLDVVAASGVGYIDVQTRPVALGLAADQDAQWDHRRIPVLAHVTADDVAGKHVLGVLPLSLARHAASVTEVAMPLLRPEQRGNELTPAEMDAAGARLSEPLCVRSLTLVLAGAEALRDGSADGNATATELRYG